MWYYFYMDKDVVYIEPEKSAVIKIIGNGEDAEFIGEEVGSSIFK